VVVNVNMMATQSAALTLSGLSGALPAQPQSNGVVDAAAQTWCDFVKSLQFCKVTTILSSHC